MPPSEIPSTPPTWIRCRRIGQRCTAVSASLGLLGLIAWAGDLPRLSSWHRDYVPMSLFAAAGLVCFSMVLWFSEGPGRIASRGLQAFARTMALLFGSAGLGIAFTKVWGKPPLAQTSASIIARAIPDVSPLTGISFFAVAAAVWWAGDSDRRANGLKALCGSLVLIIHAVVMLGYLYGTPLLYGGSIRPVGITSALAFLVLAAALVLFAGPEHFPLKPLVGPTVQARLLRTFLPLTFVTVLLSEILSAAYRSLAISNDALQDALQTLIATLLVSIAVERVARRIGGQIDSAQQARSDALAALEEARQELEERVQHRTADLERANRLLQAEIARAHRAQTALEQAQRRQQALLDAIPEWVIRVCGKEIDVKVPALLERYPAAPGNTEWAQEFAADFLRRFPAQIEQARIAAATSDFHFESVLQNQVREFEARVTGLSENEVVAIIRDVTEARRLQRQFLQIRAREQLRIGQDMHDGLGQLLTGVAFLTKALHASLDAAGRARDQAAEIGQLVSRAIAWTRRLAQGLVAPELQDRPLPEALNELANTSTELFQVRCTASCSSEGLEIQPAIATHLFRIAQEAIHNAVRHGHATQIQLQLSYQDQLCLRIVDNGSGFSPPPRNWPGVGLPSMRYRAQEIGARFEICALPEGGTAVTCFVPQNPSPLLPATTPSTPEL